jgi:hypothetical protein
MAAGNQGRAGGRRRVEEGRKAEGRGQKAGVSGANGEAGN